jgi:hypothetical protein
MTFKFENNNVIFLLIIYQKSYNKFKTCNSKLKYNFIYLFYDHPGSLPSNLIALSGHQSEDKQA